MRHHLVRLFRGGVQARGLIHSIGLGERHLGVQPIHRAGGGVDDAGLRLHQPRGLQDVHEAFHVGLDIRRRVLDGVADARLRRQGQDVRELMLLEEALDPGPIVQVQIQGHHAGLLQRLGPRALEARRVVRVEIVDAEHAVAPLFQRDRRLHTDESSGPGNEDQLARRGLERLLGRHPLHLRRGLRHRTEPGAAGLGPRVADAVDLEADALQGVAIQKAAPIEEEGRLHHHGVELAVVVRLELVPLGEHDDGMRIVHGRIRRGAPNEPVLVHLHVVVFELRDRVLLFHLGVVNMQIGPVLQEHVAHGDGGGLAHVAGVLLERKPEDGDLLVSHRVEEAADDLPGETRLLVLVHVHDLLPVLGDLWQALGLADVHEVEDVLLEARPAEADRCIQKLGADPRVSPDGAGDLGDVGPGLFAEQRDGVDAADALREHGVRDELRELRAPKIRREDPLSRHPIRVNVHQDLRGRRALGGRRAADEYAVRVGKVSHGRAFGQEFRVRQDPKLMLALVRGQHPGQGLRGLHRHRGLLDDDLAAVRMLRNGAADALDEAEVGGAPGADAAHLGRGVHGSEDDVGVLNGLGDVRGEEKILAPALLDDFE
mmetsp:Transcript_2408/g.7055  ORF Transcript_2408/g.7055 Transcript_2408/m.7055 type:complete len:600 (-) Transcript_2408:266-2065(-)